MDDGRDQPPDGLLEPRIEAALAEARASWPQVRVAPGEFARRWTGLLESGAERPCASDLYLACACGLGDEAALAACDETFLRPLACSLQPSELAEEVVQSLREKLFVLGQIALYSGRAPLAHFLRVAATRAMQKLRRHEERATSRGEVSDALADPELSFLKARHRQQFSSVFREALAALPSRDRTLLRLHYAEGVSAEALGTMHQVHRATATRWLAQSRQTLLDELRRRLAGQLRLSSAEADSLVRFVRSRFELSLRGALVTP